MQDVPVFVLLVAAAGVVALSVYGLRGWVDIRDALRTGELARLDAPSHWIPTRAFGGMLSAAPVLIATAPLGRMGWLAACSAAAIGYAAAPPFLASARRRVEREMLDDLPLHLELIALALESGSSLSMAFAACAERAPNGALRRAWQHVLSAASLDDEPLEILRALGQHVGLAPLRSLLHALRAAQKLGVDYAPLLRDKARQCAAQRFARAEYVARAAPLKLWAALLLCLAPCSMVVLAYPAARMLSLVLGN